MLNEFCRKQAAKKLTHTSVLERIGYKITDRRWRKKGFIKDFGNGLEAVDIDGVTADNLKRNYIMWMVGGAAAVLGNICAKRI